MKPDVSNINVSLFLKNIKNLPAIYTALNMLEVNYFSQNSFYQIINKIKIQFLSEITPILNFIEIINERSFTKPPIFNTDQLLLIKKTIESFDFQSDELLKIIKQKFDEIYNFIVLIINNFSVIDFPENYREKIRLEVLIVKHELFSSQ